MLSRTDRLPVLLALGALATLAGCGGGSHPAGSASANVTPAPSGAAAQTQTTGGATSTAKGAAPGTPGAGGSGTGGRSSTGAGSSGGSGAKRSDSAYGSHGAGVSHGHGAHGNAGAPGSTGGVATTTTAPSAGAPNSGTGIPFEVSTSSMEPTYQPETKVYYNPTSTHPQLGEVVVFYLPAGGEGASCGGAMIGGQACAQPVPGITKSKLIGLKRVVGLPGDQIAIRDGRVIRNGQPEPEPPTLPCGKDEKNECEFPKPITVPAGDYYVMGDNRGLAKEDSRILGAIPQALILGTVEGSGVKGD